MLDPPLNIYALLSTIRSHTYLICGVAALKVAYLELFETVARKCSTLCTPKQVTLDTHLLVH